MNIKIFYNYFLIYSVLYSFSWNPKFLLAAYGVSIIFYFYTSFLILNRMNKIPNFLKFFFFLSMFFLFSAVLVSKSYSSNYLKIATYYNVLLLPSISLGQNYKNRKYIEKILKYSILIFLIPYIGNFLLGVSNNSSIFVNQNVAVFYLIVISLIMTIYYNSIVLLLLFYSLVFFLLPKLGGLLAILLSFLYFFRKRITNPRIMFGILSILFMFLLLLNVSEIQLINRMEEVYRNINFLITDYGRNLTDVSFKEAVNSTGSKDLSFLARIKIWDQSIDLFQKEENWKYIFGIGLENIEKNIFMEQPAHNDILGLFIEGGVPLWISFFGIQLFIFKKNKNSLASIPLLAIILYYFTENLYDTYLPMILLFYFYGTVFDLATKKRTV